MIWVACYVVIILGFLLAPAFAAPLGWQDAAGFHLGEERACDRQAERLRREVERAGVHATHVTAQEARHHVL